MSKLQQIRPQDPILATARIYWPHVRYYKEQREIFKSLRENVETVVVAGNQLGKDFVAGAVSLLFFCYPQLFFDPRYVKEAESSAKRMFPGLPTPRRVVTTSVKDDHLRVLWGEIGRYLRTTVMPITVDGQELVVNHHEIRLKAETDSKNPTSYLLGQVSAKGEGMAGHHAPYTLCVIDEASGVDEEVYDQARTWGKKMFIFGNPNDCDNFFKRMVVGGDVK